MFFLVEVGVCCARVNSVEFACVCVCVAVGWEKDGGRSERRADAVLPSVLFIFFCPLIGIQSILFT